MKPLHRLFILCSICLILILAVAWIAFERQQRLEVVQQQRAVAMDEHWPVLRETWRAAIERFDARVMEKPLEEEDMVELQQAIHSWREFRDQFQGLYVPEATPMLREIQERIDFHLSDILWKRSNELETSVVDALLKNPGCADTIQENLADAREAYRAQKRLNNDHPQSLYFNLAREAALRSWLQDMEALPSALELNSIRSTAGVHFEKQEWLQAKISYEEAVALQRQINHAFPNSTQANLTLLARDIDRVHEATAHLMHVESTDFESTANNYLKEGDEALALKAFQEALQLQRRINEQWPTSSVASSERMHGLHVQVQTLQSAEAYARILQLNSELQLLLSERMLEQSRFKIEDLLDACKNYRLLYPLSPDQPNAIHERVTFLHSAQPRLSGVVDSVGRSVHQNPSTNHTVTNLIPQELYSAIMGNNPSRTRNKEAPVDSVSLLEALTFCQRLGWVIAQPVELLSRKQILNVHQITGFHEWTTDRNAEGLAATIMLTDTQHEPVIHHQELSHRSRNLSFRVQILPETP